MAKPPDEKPDPEEIQKRIKEVTKVSKKLAECKKHLNAIAEDVKELDKLVN